MNEEEYAAGISDKVPNFLYKYKSLAGPSKEYTRDLIVNQSLYFAAPSDLNDPFECKPHLSTVATAEQQKRYIVGLVGRTNPGATRAERRRLIKEMGSDGEFFRDNFFKSISATFQAAGIFSLSARHDDLLMWPHYADNHRGVCVRLSMQALLNAGQVPFPVIYAAQRPICDTILESNVEWLNKAVLTKGKPWEYEEEWRLVQNRGARQTVRLATPTVNGVILGANIAASDRAEVLRWIEEADRPIGVAQAKFHPSSYQLELHDI